jgi:enoyl-CoA hydratase/carnithine racemase
VIEVSAPADGVAVVKLNRPEKRNALSIALRTQVADALDSLAGDAAVNCVVLTGAGSAFSSGMDVTEFGGDAANRRSLFESSERLFGTVARCPVPILAAVNGPALAGGFVLALLCDVRLAGLRAQFGFPEVGRYIPPSYAAARAALAPGIARWLCLTGRIVDAGEARRFGIVGEVVDDSRLEGRAVEIGAAFGTVGRVTKQRILMDHERLLFPLLEEETRVLRKHLLG